MTFKCKLIKHAVKAPLEIRPRQIGLVGLDGLKQCKRLAYIQCHKQLNFSIAFFLKKLIKNCLFLLEQKCCRWRELVHGKLTISYLPTNS